MNLIEVIKKRFSCRQFDPAFKISQEEATLLIRAAIEAPSAGNLQPWYFFLVFCRKMKRQLASAAWGQNFLTDASLLIVVCADLKRSAAVYGERGSSLYAIQDCAAATENILLQATAMGFDSCWIGAFDEAQVERILRTELRPLNIIALGKGSSGKTKPARIPLEMKMKIFE